MSAIVQTLIVFVLFAITLAAAQYGNYNNGGMNNIWYNLPWLYYWNHMDMPFGFDMPDSS